MSIGPNSPRVPITLTDGSNQQLDGGRTEPAHPHQSETLRDTPEQPSAHPEVSSNQRTPVTPEMPEHAPAERNNQASVDPVALPEAAGGDPRVPATRRSERIRSRPKRLIEEA